MMRSFSGPGHPPGLDAPGSDRAAAAQYLDLLAETYLHLDKPAIAYRDWLGRAERTLTDAEVNSAHEKLVAQFKQTLAAVIRES